MPAISTPLKFVASMTGFARAAGTSEPFRFAWELKTVNSKGLDLRVRVPPGFDAVEPGARAVLAKRLSRGACNATLVVDRETTAPSVRINSDLLAALIAALRTVSQSGDIRPASLDGLLSIRGVVETEVEPTAGAAATEAMTTAVLQVLDTALDALVAMRRTEGTALAGVLAQRLIAIEILTTAADANPARKPEAVRAALSQTIATLLGTASALDPDRLHQEAVLLASKADIREELDRLHAHVAAARTLLTEGGSIGRRLDFLAQEFAREANTLCAKANHISLTAIGLELKSEIEQLREQIQNLE